VERVIAKVLSKEPAGRYRTADQLGRILTNYRDNSLEDTGPLGKTGEKQPTAVPVAERKTEYYQREATPTAERKTEYYHPDEPTAARRARADSPTLGPADYPQPLHYAEPEPETADATAIILSILALISLLGLIPLWYIVFLKYTAGS
jgi:hypothetical protein